MSDESQTPAEPTLQPQIAGPTGPPVFFVLNDYLVVLEGAPESPLPFSDRRSLKELWEAIKAAKRQNKHGFIETDTWCGVAADVRHLLSDPGADEDEDEEPESEQEPEPASAGIDFGAFGQPAG